MKKNLSKLCAVLMSLVMVICVFSAAMCSAQNSDDGHYKNVILLIGDGMGINSIKAANSLGVATPNIDSMPVRGWSKTRSLSSSITDSAAGGTALACGVRTYNGGIANFFTSPFAVLYSPVSLTDVAAQEGKATGVVTTDETSGATPAAFSANSLVRVFEQDISYDQLASGIDLIWGGASASITESLCSRYGYTYIDSQTDMDALEAGSRSFGQFSYDDFSNITDNNDTPKIAEMTEKAISLLSADEDGFFLMVEGAQIDKKSHDNKMPEMAAQLGEFDKAIGAALAFARQDGDTLVVITADHETGGITFNEADGSYYYTKDSHTGVNVPLLVSADDAGFADGEAINNYQVSRNIANELDTDGVCNLPTVFSPLIEFLKRLFSGIPAWGKI